MITVDGIVAPSYRAVEVFPGASCLIVGQYRARFVVDLAAAPVPYAASDFTTQSTVCSRAMPLDAIVRRAKSLSLVRYSLLDPSASGSCVVRGIVRPHQGEMSYDMSYDFVQITSAETFDSKVAARRAFLDGRSAEEWVVLVPEDPRLNRLFAEDQYEGFQGLSEWRVLDEARRALSRIRQRVSGVLAERRDEKRERKQRARPPRAASARARPPRARAGRPRPAAAPPRSPSPRPGTPPPR